MNALKKLAATLVSELLAIGSAAAISLLGGRAVGLFHGTQTMSEPGFQYITVSIIDEGTIAFFASIACAIVAAGIAASGAGIGRSAILGILSGAIVAAGAIGISKAGFSEGP